MIDRQKMARDIFESIEKKQFHDESWLANLVGVEYDEHINRVKYTVKLSYTTICRCSPGEVVEHINIQLPEWNHEACENAAYAACGWLK